MDKPQGGAHKLGANGRTSQKAMKNRVFFIESASEKRAYFGTYTLEKKK